MVKLFETTHIKGVSLANRFIRSATWEGMATEDGACTPRLVDLMAGLARGGVGLIITSHAYVRPDGQASPWQLGIYKDELVEGLKEMAEAVHKNGGRIALQISHAGIYGNVSLTGHTPLGPSRVKGLSKSLSKNMGMSSCKVLTLSEIREIVKAFGEGARRAKEAGFDGVQIHAAHGYLLSQFLSPVFNKRADAYGGSVEKRALALIEVLQRVRDTVGAEFPVLVKMNSQDFLEGGFTCNDSMQVGAMLEEAGVDAIELSGGTLVYGELGPARKGTASEENEAYFRKAARAFKEKVHVPLALVGGIRSFQVAEELVKGGVADYISMSRPFVREPNLINRWRTGDLRKARCVSDNLCFASAMRGEGICCVVEKRSIAK